MEPPRQPIPNFLTKPDKSATRKRGCARAQRAGRTGLGGEELTPAELAHQRQHVALELRNSNLDAQYLAGR